MFLTYCVYLSLAVCLAGVLWRMGRWFTLSIGPEAPSAPPRARIAACLHATSSILTRPVIAAIVKAWVVDVLIQRQIARKSVVRWVMHMTLFYGFVSLILLHALDDLTLARWDPDYAATANPYMLLRNLMGLFVLTGIIIALVRRHTLVLLKRFNTRADKVAIALCAAILLSGVGLEAVQISSAPLFDEMVQDYFGGDDPEEITSLKAYWAAYYEVVFPQPPVINAQSLETGQTVHEDNCAACHSPPTYAIAAYPVVKIIKPLAPAMGRIRLDIGLWYIHVLASCIALAYLPFGKLFHLISVPVSLAARAVGDTRGNAPLNRHTRRAIGLDACTHCGVCALHCSVAPLMAVIDNPDILPSEKIGDLSLWYTGRLERNRQWRLARGGNICTACGRCTDVCPAGIDLQDLWQASQTDLIDSGYFSPHGWIRTNDMVAWSKSAKTATTAADSGMHLVDNPDTFWACVQCTICTNVCPVVATSEDPRRDLDLTPQQVMNLVRLQLKDMALGCRMVWDCVTCYRCQEECPQKVPVADVLYELRNEACRRLHVVKGPTSKLSPSDLQER